MIIILLILSISGCSDSDGCHGACEVSDSHQESWNNKEINIEYGNFQIKTFINKPEGNEFDAILLFHGTSYSDEASVNSALKFSKVGKDIQEEIGDMMTISVAYRETGILPGDEIQEAEAALLWLMDNADEEYGFKINNIYLLGHSRGGNMVTVLNTKHKTDGIIADSPGPVDLLYTCGLVESGELSSPSIPATRICPDIEKAYGDTKSNPSEYEKRSLINNIDGPKSRMLFIQGLKNQKMQSKLMKDLMEKLDECSDCPDYELLELESVSHWSFDDAEAMKAIYEFINAG